MFFLKRYQNLEPSTLEKAGKALVPGASDKSLSAEFLGTMKIM